MSRPWAEALDALAGAVFEGDVGWRRLAPLVACWDDQAAPLRDEDPDYAHWQMIRTDWALCEALPPDARGPGDTWVWRAVRGELGGWQPRPEDPILATSITGLFEVWPSRVPWLRDCIGGFCVELADPVRLEPPGDGGPAALWEVRLAIEGGRGYLCRPPLDYPLEILQTIRERQLQRFTPAGHRLSLPRLRRARLRWRRAERADASLMFRISEL